MESIGYGDFGFGTEVNSEISSVLVKNYLPYAVETIVDRAIPAIDGLKPSQRKILYTMYKMGLLDGDKTK